MTAENSVVRCDTIDGWTVDFDKYVITMGAFNASMETGDPTADGHTFVVELQAFGGFGRAL